MIPWKNDYDVGVHIIDEQHKKLFEIADSAFNLLENKLVIDKYDKFVEILDELKEYTIFHFKSEEEYMLSIKYKNFFFHKVEHDDFINEINNIDLDKIDLDQNESVKELLEFVVNWIDKHILSLDRYITV